MNDLALARALHVLAIVHWIGGVFMVTTTLLITLRRLNAADPIALFEAIEGRFGAQAKWSTQIAGLSGLYLLWQMDAWDRFLDPAYWWMHAMVAVWALFTLVLFVLEPLVLHRWFHARAQRDPAGTLRLVTNFHRLLLTISLITIAGAVIGAHGGVF